MAGTAAAAVAAGTIFAWAAVGVFQGTDAPPARPACRPIQPAERLAPACAETLEGCSTYSHR